MLSRLFIAALWSPAGKGLTSWDMFVVSYCYFVAFPCGILGQVWHLIVLIPDLCRLAYFELHLLTKCLNYDHMSAERLQNFESFFAAHYFFAAFCVNVYLLTHSRSFFCNTFKAKL